MTHGNQVNRAATRRVRKAAFGWIAAAAMLAVPALAAAQPEANPKPSSGPNPEPVDETAKMGGENRVLNRHSFITPSLTPSALMNASFSFRQGGGMYKYDDGTNAAKLFLYGQQFLVQIGIVNRVAIDLTFGGAAAVGGDVDTLLNLGAIAFLNVGAMPRVRIWTWEKIGLQLAAGVGTYYDRFIVVSPGNALEQAAKTGNLNGVGKSLVTQSQAFTVAPTIMLAEGIGPFGAQFAQSVRIGAAGDAKANSFVTALHLAFDFRRISPVPFALTGEYQADYGIDHKQVTHTVSPGLFYTGRRDLSLGAVAVVEPPKNNQTLIQAQVVMQYFF